MTGGIAPRRKGANAERQAVNWLRTTGIAPDARRYLAGDGRQPGDIDAIPGVCLEVKAAERPQLGLWLAQADDECQGRLPAVWCRLRGTTDPGAWPLVLRARNFFPLLEDR